MVQWIDALVFDMMAFRTGKRIPRVNLPRCRKEQPQEADPGLHHGSARQLRGEDGDPALDPRPVLGDQVERFARRRSDPGRSRGS
jgi:hypothetical protein